MDDGLYTSSTLPEADYFALKDRASASKLKSMAKSPAHSEVAFTTRETVAKRMGSAIHAAVLEPQRFKREYKVGPDASRATKRWKDWAKEHPFAELLKPAEAEIITGCVDAIKAHPVARVITEGEGAAEVSGLGELNGVPVKARADYLMGDLVIDLKTCEQADRFEFDRRTFMYELQTALYLDLFSKLLDTNMRWQWVVVEKSPPYGVRVLEPSEGLIAYGRWQYTRLLTTYAECLESGVWPCYSQEVGTIDATSWEIDKMGGF